MVLSMTGYGRAQGHFKQKTITVELRSLNGKTTDIRTKIPSNYKEKELDLRKKIIDNALRGKFDFSISIDENGALSDVGINKNLFKTYFKQLKDLDKELGFDNVDYVQSILRIPNVVQSEETELDSEEWNFVLELTSQTLKHLENYRVKEGDAMEEDLKQRIIAIQQFLNEVKKHEPTRIEELKLRLHKRVEEYKQKTGLDQNRLEQEILFYLEKMDINEEKVRLEQHCIYFLEELDKKQTLKGRKLSFIAQEIGREINTMGAKAQFTEIQRLVVKMKNELEKIKEQLANLV